MIPTVTRILPSRVSSPLLLVTMLMLAAAGPVSGSDAETCFSRQHQNATVNVRQALARPTTVMDSRVAQSERDCVLACCSEDVKPGITCTLAVFNPHKPSEPPNNHNCHLVHCQNEQDCPLQAADHGINTYDIFKGKHVSLQLERLGLPNTSTPSYHPSSTNTRRHPATTSPAPTPRRHPATTPPAPTPRRHPATTSPAPTPRRDPATTPPAPTPRRHPATTPPAPTPRRHPDPIRTTERLQPATTTTTTTTTTAATTTTMTPTDIEPLNPRTTPEKDMLLVPKGVQADPASPGTEGQGGGKEVAGRGALKSSLVAVVVVGLAILTLALAVVGRKAMESFDRRHYTRLELNDLHYEV
ncbi:proteoglycan 4 [Coregonus clupeaformis]|uniref:proteoglycan 4 n=1 Tax=Coregonus clupeaformis TaxID=59861 RepID=UPI001E1C70FA|nr:proteoglycan 4 [Coregonus clupeaformis]